jgi:hypothetical protein
MTFGQSTSGKLSGFWIQESSALCMVPGDSTEVLQRCGGYTYEQGGLRGRVGNERGGEEMDRCPLTVMKVMFSLFFSIHLLSIWPIL